MQMIEAWARWVAGVFGIFLAIMTVLGIIQVQPQSATLLTINLIIFCVAATIVLIVDIVRTARR